MRGTAATIIAALCWAVPGPALPGAPPEAQAAEAIRLKLGESAQTGNGAVRVGFDAVIADSRCPMGEQCIWAGDAVVKIWLQRGSGAKETRVLHTAPRSAPQPAGAVDPDVRLLRLDPSPISGKAVAQGDYVATLTLQPAPRPAADR